MKLIERAKSHFESLGVQSIEVEEWADEDGNPSIIYWNPITLPPPTLPEERLVPSAPK